MKRFSQSIFDRLNKQDFDIICREVKGARLAVISPHGGGVEPGTSELAEEIAGSSYHLYCFLGRKYEDNQELHVKSTLFDEPRALSLLKKAETCLSLHGCQEEEEIVYIGGLNKKLYLLTCEILTQNGFQVINAPDSMGAKSLTHICNRCSGGKGLQLELSYGLRKNMFENVDRRKGREKVTPVFHCFVESVRKALKRYDRFLQ